MAVEAPDTRDLEARHWTQLCVNVCDGETKHVIAFNSV